VQRGRGRGGRGGRRGCGRLLYPSGWNSVGHAFGGGGGGRGGGEHEATEATSQFETVLPVGLALAARATRTASGTRSRFATTNEGGAASTTNTYTTCGFPQSEESHTLGEPSGATRAKPRSYPRSYPSSNGCATRAIHETVLVNSHSDLFNEDPLDVGSRPRIALPLAT
jgi:hypothetical protein